MISPIRCATGFSVRVTIMTIETIEIRLLSQNIFWIEHGPQQFNWGAPE